MNNETELNLDLEAPEAEAAPAIPAEAPAPALPERVTVCDVQFRSGSKLYFFDPGDLPLKTGDHVIIETARGPEYGYCVTGPHRAPARDVVQPLRRVLRIATAVDEKIKAENERREKAAFAFCQKKIEELGLDMQLASAECAFDGSKLLFFFTADARVDFRELVKLLAAAYHTRIELRQIGVRDKARMFGGLGICGRPFCCSSFLGDFEPVSIKMAKTQSLSLNPTKISGTCGRLMCCLKYEQEAYEDLIKNSPKPDSFVDTPEGRGTVTNVNLMRQSVDVRMEKDPEEIHNFKNSEVFVLRSGKARKTDPPIPDDLAPISGRKDVDPLSRLSRLEQRLVLSPEEAEPVSAPEAEPAPKPARRRERRSERPAAQPKPEAERPAQTPEHEQPARAKEASETETAPKQQRHGNSRGRRGGNRGGQKPAQNQQKQTTEAIKPIREPKQDPRPAQPREMKQNRGQKQNPKPNWEKQEKVPGSEPQKKNNRRRYYHNRKPKQGE